MHRTPTKRKGKNAKGTSKRQRTEYTLPVRACCVEWTAWLFGIIVFRQESSRRHAIATLTASEDLIDSLLHKKTATLKIRGMEDRKYTVQLQTSGETPKYHKSRHAAATAALGDKVKDLETRMAQYERFMQDQRVQNAKTTALDEALVDRMVLEIRDALYMVFDVLTKSKPQMEATADRSRTGGLSQIDKAVDRTLRTLRDGERMKVSNMLRAAVFHRNEMIRSYDPLKVLTLRQALVEDSLEYRAFLRFFERIRQAVENLNRAPTAFEQNMLKWAQEEDVVDGLSCIVRYLDTIVARHSTRPRASASASGSGSA